MNAQAFLSSDGYAAARRFQVNVRGVEIGKPVVTSKRNLIWITPGTQASLRLFSNLFKIFEIKAIR